MSIRSLLDVSGLIGNTTTGLNFRIGDITSSQNYIKIVGSGTSTGYIGINTDDPNYQLDISGHTNSTNLSVTSSSEMYDLSVNNILNYHSIYQGNFEILDSGRNLKDLSSIHVAEIELSGNIITSLQDASNLVLMANVGVGDDPTSGFKMDISGNLQVRDTTYCNHLQSYITDASMQVHSDVILDDGKQLGIGLIPNDNIQLDISGDLSCNSIYNDYQYVNVIKGRDEGQIDISNNTMFLENVSIQTDVHTDYVLDVSGDSRFTDVSCQSIETNICNSLHAGTGQLFILSASCNQEISGGLFQFSFGGSLPTDWGLGNYSGCYLGFSYRIVSITLVAPEKVGETDNAQGLNGIELAFFFEGYTAITTTSSAGTTNATNEMFHDRYTAATGGANDPTADTIEKFILDCSYDDPTAYYILKTSLDVSGIGEYITTTGVVEDNGEWVGTNLVKDDEILYVFTINEGLGGTAGNKTSGIRMFLTCITEDPIYNV